jgi:hypothetical protein
LALGRTSIFAEFDPARRRNFYDKDIEAEKLCWTREINKHCRNTGKIISCKVQKGQNVLIEATAFLRNGKRAYPRNIQRGRKSFVELYDNKVKHALLSGMTEELATHEGVCRAHEWRKCTAYIGIRGGTQQHGACRRRQRDIADVSQGLTVPSYTTNIRVNRTTGLCYAGDRRHGACLQDEHRGV